MNIGTVSNKHPDFHTSTFEYQKLSDEKIVREVDRELWSIECTIDQLELNLSSAAENITCLEHDDDQRIKKLTVHKYFQQAKDLSKWIPIARPVSEFVINARDLSQEVIEELESRIDDLPTLSYILKQAVGRIFENLGHAYYHQSIARNLRVRIEP